MSYLRYLCIMVSNPYRVVFLLCFLRLVYHMLPVSLDCLFVITPSVFSDVYTVSRRLDIRFKNRNRRSLQQHSSLSYM